MSYFSSNTISLKEFQDKLIKLKHRGQDSCGVTFLKNGKINKVTKHTFKELENETKNEVSYNILGHTRYTTSGSKNIQVFQPFKSENKFGEYNFAFNGNIPIEEYLDSEIYESDTLMIADFLDTMSYEHSNWVELLKFFMNYFQKSYNLIIQTENSIFVVKDSFGVRPLFYTENKQTNTFLFSSESYIFNNFDVAKEVSGGTILAINKYGLKNVYDYGRYYQTHCLFEYIYFLNKKSKFDNMNVELYRKNVGKILANQDSKNNCFINKEDYIVVGVPNTGNDYAFEYANEMKLKYKNYIRKNKDVNRTFILKDNSERNKFANMKYILDDNLKNKNIVLIDDSLVRGITLKNLIKNLRQHGVKQIHVRIASPPIINPCLYGIDIPTKEELIYNNFNNTEGLNEYLNSDSLKYIKVEKLLSILPNNDKKCTLCLNIDPKLEW